jgi:hypothetical protein
MEIPAYVNSVPLRKDVSKALIDGGVFNHGPSQVIWALPVDPSSATANPTPAEVAAKWAAANPMKIVEPMTAAEMRARFAPQLPAPRPSLSLSVVKLPKAGELHPIEVPKEGSKKVAKLFDLAEAALALPGGLSKIPASGLSKIPPAAVRNADAFAGLLAGPEIVIELVHPKHRHKVEALFFYADKSATVANAIFGLIPALSKAKPYLGFAVLLLNFGDKVCLAFETDDKVGSGDCGSADN